MATNPRLPARPRGQPIPDAEDDGIVQELLREIEEEEALAAAIGVALEAAAPSSEHAPAVYLALEEWWRRSEEVHRFLEETNRRERGAGGPRHPEK